MKSFSLVLTFIAILFLSVSCQNPKQVENGIKVIGEVNEGDCLLQELKYHYSNFELSFYFTYSEDNKVISTKKYIDNKLEQKVDYKYSSDGLIIGLERFFNDTLSDKCILNYLDDSIEFIVMNLVENNWVKSNVLQLHYNENNEIVKVEDFEKKDDGEWDFFGSGYNHKWVDGKLTETQNWVFQIDTLGDVIKADGFIKKNASVINDRAFMYDNKYYYDNNEIELFYESTFEYDSKNNPFRDISLARFIFPSDFNASVNNPTTIVKTYTSGEKLMLNTTYEYNDKNYPVKANVQVKFESEIDNSPETEYTIEYSYKNCK